MSERFSILVGVILAFLVTSCGKEDKLPERARVPSATQPHLAVQGMSRPGREKPFAAVGPLAPADSAALDEAMVAKVKAEGLAELKRQEGSPISFRSTRFAEPDRQQIRIRGSDCEIEHNWNSDFRWSRDDGPTCNPPYPGVVARAVTAIPLVEKRIPAGSILLRRKKGWERAAPQDVVGQLRGTLKTDKDKLESKEVLDAVTTCAVLGPDAKPFLDDLVAILEAMPYYHYSVCRALAATRDARAITPLRSHHKRLVRKGNNWASDVERLIGELEKRATEQ